jgi:hypothetical protein
MFFRVEKLRQAGKLLCKIRGWDSSCEETSGKSACKRFFLQGERRKRRRKRDEREMLKGK